MAAARIRVKLHPEAFDELAALVHFYAERDHRVAEIFKIRIREAFRDVEAYPLRFPAVGELPDVRKYKLHHFPVSVLYIIRSDTIWVIAIAHSRRRPRYWKSRMTTKR